MGMIKRLVYSIILNAAGGSSRALGSACVACPNFRDGNSEALVMPETPSVISVGERCMDHGLRFVWPAGQRPYLLLPSGHKRGAGSVDVRGCRQKACESRAAMLRGVRRRDISGRRGICGRSSAPLHSESRDDRLAHA
eukprot:1514543-Pyramimonas_sp.AAC.1